MYTCVFSQIIWEPDSKKQFVSKRDEMAYFLLNQPSGSSIAWLSGTLHLMDMDIYRESHILQQKNQFCNGLANAQPLCPPLFTHF
jgi:hypothetical protein